MRTLASLLTHWLIKSGKISDQEEDLFTYAIFCVLFTVFPLTLVLMISSAMNMITEGLWLIIPLLFLRKFAGGFHFKSSMVCFVTSCIILFLFLLMIRITTNSSNVFPFIIAVIICSIILSVYSPIDSDERKLSKSEKRLYKGITLMLVAAVHLFCAIFYLHNNKRIYIPLGASLILTALLQLPCILTRKLPFAVQKKENR